MCKRIHFIGIGGVGMAGLAYLLKRQGHQVDGCDKYLTARTRWLEAAGIPVSRGHDPAHAEAADMVVATPAIARDEEEFRRAGSRVRWRGDVLAELVNATEGLAVCGTHGKTTTATFLAKLLAALGEDPSWCIGGETRAMPVAGTGRGPLVVEADESDGTLAAYRAHTLVLNAVDFDHLEHFDSPQAYFGCYRKALAQTRDRVVVSADQPRAVTLAREACGRAPVTFGFAPDADVRAADWPELFRAVPGRHNICNALAAIAVALLRGHSREAIRQAVGTAFDALPDRRFELVHSPPETPSASPGADITVITDYAHHPAELRCALDMARARNPKRLRILFQPHRYSRTRALCRDFPGAFEEADEVVLIPVYPAFEGPLPGGDIAHLYRAFREHQEGTADRKLWPGGLLLARSAREAWRHAFLTAQPGDLIVLAGAGDIIRLVAHVREDCARPLPVRNFRDLAPCSFFRTGGRTCGGGSPCIVGHGSNTWFSDCADDCEIVKPDLPAGASFGIPWMVGIPGTIGGWVKMNAGAFGHSIAERVEAVEIERKDGSRAILPAEACGFAYRSSAIADTIVDVRLKPAPAGDAQETESYRRRRKTFPPRTCGSVFKNPPQGLPAGACLEKAGAKDLRVGGAYVWREHANVIVAGEGATSSDILALARIMALAVYFASGVRLEPEIRGLDTSF